MNARHVEAFGLAALDELETRLKPTLDELAQGQGYTVHVSGLNFRPAEPEDVDGWEGEGELEWVLELFYVVENHPAIANLATKTCLALRAIGLDYDKALEAVVSSIEQARMGRS